MQNQLRILIFLFLGLGTTVYAKNHCSSYLGSSLKTNADFSSFVIDQKALKHIFSGEIVSTKNPAGQRIYQISGGLHTYEGLQDFLKLRPDIKSLYDARYTVGGWYETTLSRNGVLYLRLPESAYTKKSLKSLWSADLYLNSGYLWKTLFPKDLSQEEILNLIQEVLRNPGNVIQRGWSTVVTGDVRLQNGRILSLTIYLDSKTKTVISAFPSFNQPIYQGSGMSALGLHRQAVIIVNTESQLEYVKENASVIIPKFDLFKRTKRKVQTVHDWNTLTLNQKNNIIAEQVFSFVDLSGLHIGGSDLSLRLILEHVDYTPGDKYTFAGQLLLYYLNDRAIPVIHKYEILKKLILVTVINDDSFAFDILWSKFIFNLILRSEYLFETKMFERLITILSESPFFWTLLVTTYESNFFKKSPDRTFLNIMNIMRYFSFNHSEFMLNDLDRMQIENFNPIFNLYYSNWKSEIAFLKRLALVEIYGPNGDQNHKMKKYIVDYLNSLIVYFHDLKNSSNPVSYNFISLFTLFNPELKTLRSAISLLKEYDPKFNISGVLNRLEVFINFSEKALENIRRTSVDDRDELFDNALEAYLKKGRHYRKSRNEFFIPQLFISNDGTVGYMIVLVNKGKSASETPE